MGGPKTKANSEEYEPDSLTGFFRNINTHLQNVGYAEDILESATFRMAGQTLSSRRKQLKGKGKAETIMLVMELAPLVQLNIII